MGSNNYGQLGDGTTANKTAPGLVSSLSGVIAIDCGIEHSLALKSDGTVWAWGRNGNGQLGDVTTTNSSSPVQASGLTGVIAIAVGGNHSLALKSDGTVWAWGFNQYGQLGDSTTTQRTTPVQVSGLSGVIAIASGGYHSMALKSDGTVWAWGYNSNGYGQLGDGSTTDRTTPVQVSLIGGVVAIAGGGYHSMALKSDGTVWAWGANYYGQLGDGSTTNRTTPVQVSGLTGAVAIAGGGNHSLALKSDGTVYAWGHNNRGQLGDGTTTQRYTPVLLSDLTGVVRIECGDSHSMALKSDGTVYAWGENGSGQLGDGTTTQRNTPVLLSVYFSLSFPTGSTVVTTGTATCVTLSTAVLPGIVNANGASTTVWFQYGTATGSYSSTTSTQVMSGTTTAGVSAALSGLSPWVTYYYRIAGQNDSGTTYGSESSFLPRPQIAASNGFSLSLKPDGRVWSWGSNNYGQLGDGTTANKTAPGLVSSLSGVIAIDCGIEHSLALKSDGTVWAWGRMAMDNWVMSRRQTVRLRCRRAV